MKLELENDEALKYEKICYSLIQEHKTTENDRVIKNYEHKFT